MKKYYLLIFLLLVLIIPCIPQVFHKNSGHSQSIGTISNGKLVNGYKIPFRNENFNYFSLVDYYIFGRCYTHSDIYKIVLESYEELKQTYPEYKFKIMECSSKKGGKAFPHRTHQNGTSIDFMTPLKKDAKTITRFDKIGLWRYIMKFDSDGKKRFNKNIEIDFDKMAKHILILENTSRQNGYKIKKVILETNLKDELFSSKYGSQLKASGIYFVRSLPRFINELHDDHYHIDFEKI